MSTLVLSYKLNVPIPNQNTFININMFINSVDTKLKLTMCRPCGYNIYLFYKTDILTTMQE